MGVIWAAILGTIQGITEFLPISSSGHLVLAQRLIPGFTQPGVLFDVVLHLATTVAVLIYFGKRIVSILKKDRRYLILLLVGTIPAGLAGVFLRDFLEGLFTSSRTLGLEFLFTGVLAIATDYLVAKREKIGVLDSLWVGLAQAVAIIPAISRSGATIFAGGVLGINKEKIAEFSFLLSVPAILGANVLELARHGGAGEVNLADYGVGFGMALVAGLISIKLVLATLHTRSFKYFGIYCLILGTGVILAGI